MAGRYTRAALVHDVADRRVTDQRDKLASQCLWLAKKSTIIDVCLEQPIYRAGNVPANRIHGFILTMKAVVAACVYNQHFQVGS